MPEPYISPPPLADTVLGLVERLRAPLGLHDWQIRVDVGTQSEGRALALAAPEYRELVIGLDLERLETGDRLHELIVHEATHAHTWRLHALCEQLANALADTASEYMREALRALLLERVREAAEDTTTAVGQTYWRLLRQAGVIAGEER